MAELLVTFRVMPEDVNIDIKTIKSSLKNIATARLNKVEEEPIAFGLVAIKPSFVVEEKEGTTDKLEETIRGIKGVGDVSVIGTTRLL